MNKKEKLIKDIGNRFKMKLFMLMKLPLGFFTGLRVVKITEEMASVTIPFKNLNKNPFQSIYFAALAMAAELSTGVLAMASIKGSGKNVSMLVYDMSANFSKKAKGRITFTCNQGREISETVEESMRTNEGKTVSVNTIGIDKDGDEVARFIFTWTFKPKL
ncbi:MAG: DUF4442 domain-containing protein [Bacteroidales bacterium]|nr:DUF4442 domain-containing protein [Bacteroidales bacterium]MBN2757199.1 DUF4442 domain-containing protein [Bacteroidales bacterium]